MTAPRKPITPLNPTDPRLPRNTPAPAADENAASLRPRDVWQPAEEKPRMVCQLLPVPPEEQRWEHQKRTFERWIVDGNGKEVQRDKPRVTHAKIDRCPAQKSILVPADPILAQYGAPHHLRRTVVETRDELVDPKTGKVVAVETTSKSSDERSVLTPDFNPGAQS